MSKERPILFSAPMVRAILEGRKTQTRRVIKRPPRVPEDYVLDPPGMVDPGMTWWAHPGGLRCGWSQACPYGFPGDQLWVRETHYIVGEYRQAFYAADGANNYGDGLKWSGPWKPSIHMPRWASRISLEITGVRVERLQDIQFNEADALAEGAQRARISEHAEFSACEDYKQIWRDINGAESWAANPWVWVVEFHRVSTAKSQNPTP